MAVFARFHPGLVVLAGVACIAALFILVSSSQKPKIDTAHLPAPSAPNLPTKNVFTGRASVVDGDTIDIQGTRIRLNGIDAPELGQACDVNGIAYRCGQEAAKALRDFVAARVVNCFQSGTDRWGRVVAKCAVDGTDIGEWMVKQGLALAYRKYSLEYVSEEETARIQKRGMFSGTFIAPERDRQARGNYDKFASMCVRWPIS